MTPVRVFHVDDSESFRVLVGEILRDDREVEHVGGASTVREAMERLPGVAPDVVLLDLLDREEEDVLVARLRPAAPSARFVVYSGVPDRAGTAADAHLRKSAAFDDLRRVIVEVAARS